MKKILFAITLLITVGVVSSLAQDNRSIRAARISFDSAESNYKRGNYEKAAQEFSIVIETIPATTNSRRNLELRLESLINLVDIYFYKQINIVDACTHLNMYFSTMNTIRNKGVLRAGDLLNYQRIEKEFMDQHVSKCENYEEIHDDMEEFRKKFESEFDE